VRNEYHSTSLVHIVLLEVSDKFPEIWCKSGRCNILDHPDFHLVIQTLILDLFLLIQEKVCLQIYVDADTENILLQCSSG
jgi:hypothetical protein